MFRHLMFLYEVGSGGSVCTIQYVTGKSFSFMFYPEYIIELRGVGGISCSYAFSEIFEGTFKVKRPNFCWTSYQYIFHGYKIIF